MSAGTSTQSSDVTFWFNGEPNTNLQLLGTIDGNITYWINGEPHAYVYPSDSSNTSNFMMFMPF